MVIARSWGWGEIEGYCFHEFRVSVLQVMEMDVDDGYVTLWMYIRLLNIYFKVVEMVNFILIWVPSNNFNRFLRSWCELTWKEMLLRRGKPNPFPLFIGLPGWMCKASVKSLPKIPRMIWGKIGWVNKYLGDDIWLDKHIQNIYNKQIGGDTPGEM